MAEIGAALREARTRARIEIAQMEAQTKIRAKYLRALENEEWELLPGPTYVKSFLKTYGDMLGLDGRQLVAEYKSAHEPFQAADDIGQISKHTGGRMNRQQPGPPPIVKLAALVLLVLAAVGGGAYYVLSGRESDTPAVSGEPVTETTAVAEDGPAANATGAVQTVVVTATDEVTVCVRAGERIVVPERDLKAGERTKSARGRAVTVTALNRSVRLTVNGDRVALPAGPSGAITVTVTESGVRRAGAGTTACRV